MDENGVKFIVYGRPQPQGSVRAFTPKGWNRPVLTSDNKKLKSWRIDIAAIVANTAAIPLVLRPAGVRIDIQFYFTRPASAKKREFPSVKPDVDKLCRGVLDALTGLVFEDDSQVVQIVASKWYGSPERTEIILRPAVASLAESVEAMNAIR